MCVSGVYLPLTRSDRAKSCLYSNSRVSCALQLCDIQLRIAPYLYVQTHVRSNVCILRRGDYGNVALVASPEERR
jgi:hypothetical protein